MVTIHYTGDQSKIYQKYGRIGVDISWVIFFVKILFLLRCSGGYVGYLINEMIWMKKKVSQTCNCVAESVPGKVFMLPRKAKSKVNTGVEAILSDKLLLESFV
jgi:hypothetical protein